MSSQRRRLRGSDGGDGLHGQKVVGASPPSRPHRNFITPKPLWELSALPKLAGFKGNGYSDKGSSQGTGKWGGRGTGEVKEGREGRKEGMEGGREGRKRGEWEEKWGRISIRLFLKVAPWPCVSSQLH